MTTRNPRARGRIGRTLPPTSQRHARLSGVVLAAVVAAASGVASAAARTAAAGLPTEAGWPIDPSDPPPGMHEPIAVAAGPDGRVYVADAGNARILAFARDGTVAAVWGRHGDGDGRYGHLRDLAWAGSHLWVVDDAIGTLERFDADGRFELALDTAAAGIDSPAGIGGAPDGSVWVSDSLGDRLVHVSPSGAVLHRWGTSGSADGSMTGPVDVAVAADGSIIELEAYRWQRFSPAGAWRQSRGVAGREIGQFQHAWSVAADRSGGWFIGDRTADRVTRVDPRGVAVEVWGGTGVDLGRLRDPRGLAVDDDGAVVVADAGNGRIQRLVDGRPGDVYGRAAGDAPHLSYPLAVAASGESILVADTGRSRVVRLALDGRWDGTVTGGGRFPGMLSAPDGIAPDGDGLVVADTLRRRALRFAADGRYLSGIDVWGPSARPVRVGLLSLPDGGLMVADKRAHAILRYDAAGVPVGAWPPDGAPGVMGHPAGMTALPDGRLAVADWFQNAVHILAADGTHQRRWPAADDPEAAQLLTPTDVTGWGGDGPSVIVADAGHGRLAAYAPDGAFESAWGRFGAGDDGFGPSGPSALATVGDALVAVDRDNHRLLIFRERPPSGWRVSAFRDAWLGGAPSSVATLTATLGLSVTIPAEADRGPDGASSTRAEGRLVIDGGPLALRLRAPSGARLWHDGRLIVDAWNHAGGDWTVLRSAAPGPARFELEVRWPILGFGEAPATARLDIRRAALDHKAYLPTARQP